MGIKKDYIDIEFKFEREIYYDKITGFMVMKVEILKHPEGIDIPTIEHKVRTQVDDKPTIGDIYSAMGRWEQDSSFGYQFIVEAMSIVIHESIEGIRHFLQTNIKGIGKSKAVRITDRFGDDTLRVLEEEPGLLMEIKGINEKQIAIIKECTLDINVYKTVKRELALAGFNSKQSYKLYEKFGDKTLENIYKNPYICRDLGIVEFKDCDNMALKGLFNPNNKYRIRQAIIEVMWKSLINGHLYIEEDKLFKETQKFLNHKGSMRRMDLNYNVDFTRALDYLINNNELVIDRDDDENNIYIEYYYNAENNTIRILKEMISQEIETISEIEVYQFLKEQEDKGIMIGQEQKKAIKMAVTNKISIITGAAGTGKTHIINLIIKAIKEMKHNSIVEIAAPTGRASKKLKDATEIDAKTIHRLLNLKVEKDSKIYNEEMNMVNADILIIDEASMIDISLFYHLIASVKPHTQMVIVGDYNQLPSVGPGLILRDIIESGTVPTTKLSEVYRQKEGSQIIDNSYNILDGKLELVEDRDKKDFYFVRNETEDNNKDKNIDKIIRLIKRGIERGIENGFELQDIQVLSFMKKGDLGTNNLNNIIQEYINPRNPNNTEVSVRLGKDYKVNFRVGDKVIHTKNNYDFNVFNGDAGYIKDIRFIVGSKAYVEIIVDYGDREIIYSREMASQLDLAYALTVHKAQGSEFPLVICPVHSSQSKMINRNMLYTSITRAKTRMVFIGEKETYFKGINNTANVIRNSKIKEKLSAREDCEKNDNINKENQLKIDEIVKKDDYYYNMYLEHEEILSHHE